MTFCQEIFERTKDKHKKAESGPLMQKYINASKTIKSPGTCSISLAEHVKYLQQQFHLYAALEQALNQCTQLTGEFKEFLLSLKRQDAIKNDYESICHLLEIPSEINNEPKPETTKLCRQIIASSQDLTKILAYAYIQYRGLFNGGISLKSAINKLIGLQLQGDTGITFYVFGENRMWQLDNKFVNFINAMENQVDKELFIKTAINSYELHDAVFNAIEPKPLFEKLSMSAHNFWQRNKVSIAATAVVGATVALGLTMGYRD